jgi:TRAP-type mannitol/chloroaromatic compound transport system permease small subunit
MAAGAMTGEDDVPAVMAVEDDHVLGAARPRQRRPEINEHRADGRGYSAIRLLSPGNLANGAAQVARVAEIDCRDGGDGLRNNFFRIDGHAQREAHQDGELGARVESAYVFGGVGLGVSVSLREGEHIGVDILTAKLSGPARRWAEAWGMASVALISAMLVANGWETAMSSRMLGIMTSGQLEWPVWMLQLLLPFGGATMLLVALEALLRIALGLPSPQPSPQPFSAQERQA